MRVSSIAACKITLQDMGRFLSDQIVASKRTAARKSIYYEPQPTISASAKLATDLGTIRNRVASPKGAMVALATTAADTGS
jgi:hypothetical protein